MHQTPVSSSPPSAGLGQPALASAASMAFRVGREACRGERPVGLLDAPRGRAISVCPERGAELSSLRVRDGGTWRELLYRGNDWSPVDGWSGRAPWLWPVAGRCYVNGEPSELPADPDACTYLLGGRVLKMPRHGFVRDREWSLGRAIATRSSASVDCEISGRASDCQQYPFGYALRLECRLDPGGATLRFTCKSSSENHSGMPFTFGCHLTFDLAAWWGSQWLEGVVHGLGSRGFTTDERMQVGDPLALAPAPRLSDPAFASLLVPATPGGAVQLESPEGGRSLQIGFDVEASAGLAEAGEPLWVAYRDPLGRFFCLEPWVGWPNGINTGRGRVSLPPGAKWSVTLRLAALGKAAATGGVSPAASTDASRRPIKQIP